jgi:SAM-dependent methyltransferase
VVARSLQDIARSNRWFGGRQAVRYGFERLVRGRPSSPVSVLDVGTGSGDIPRHLVEVGAAMGLAVRPLALDRHPAAVRVAARSGFPTIRADGLRLPLAPRSVDIVVISQVAHHLAPAAVRALALEASRVARIGVVLADLQRSELAAFAFRFGTWALGFDRVTRLDGVTSVRRGYTVSELAGLLGSAGLEASVTYRPIARVVAIWRV